MDSRFRFGPEAVRVLLLVPWLLVLTACLPTFPVPVGDPEKSRIDPYISGTWVSTMNGKSILVLKPYDKRTWLLSVADLSSVLEACEVADVPIEDAAADQETPASGSYDEFMAEITMFGVGCYEIELLPRVWKVWRTKLGGEWFMTWEALADLDPEKGFEPDEWVVRGISKLNTNQLNLRMISDQNDAWDDIQEEDLTRRVVEKIIRKHARDPDFFEEDGDIELHRVLPEHYKLVEEFLDEG
jgi:hypothetical protein